MAIDIVAELFAEAVDSVVRREWPWWTAGKSRIVDWLRDTARPPGGVELRTDDGSTYTGFVVVERNELKLMFAVRQPAGPLPPTPAPRRDATSSMARHGSSLLGYPDPDDPRWDRDGDPFRR